MDGTLDIQLEVHSAFDLRNVRCITLKQCLPTHVPIEMFQEMKTATRVLSSQKSAECQTDVQMMNEVVLT